VLTAALVGLPLSGKTTFFEVLTARAARSGKDLGRAVVPVADRRLSVLSDVFHPRKVTAAQIAFVDVPGLAEGGQGEGRRFLADIREADALVQVIGAFPGGPGDSPDDAAESLALELALADLEAVEKRLERLARGKLKPGEDVERSVLESIRPHLEAGGPVRTSGVSPDELAALRSLGLLTEKPLVYVLNVGDDGTPPCDPEEFAGRHQGAVIVASAAMEREIADLDAAERADFLSSLGFAEPGVDRLTRACYAHLGLISFLTAGEDEVRAWTIRQGTPAREAAGKIHTDIERGFIRAEVVAYDDFVNDGASMAGAKEKGHWRLEGKDYIVADGDIINFRFNA